MEEKMTLFKFRFDGKDGFLSIVEHEGFYYSFAEKDTPKVKAAEETGKMLISYTARNPEFKEVNVSFSDDQEITQLVYKQLKEEKNFYFDQLDDSLVLLKIDKE